MKTKTYEQKMADLKEVVSLYEMGFLSQAECIFQIMSIDWNPLEQQAISSTLQRAVTIDTTILKQIV